MAKGWLINVKIIPVIKQIDKISIISRNSLS